MKNETFIRLAHRRAILGHLQQLLKEKYIAGDSSPKEVILCEEVPFTDRFVSQDALLEVLEGLYELEDTEVQRMRRFKFVEQDVPPLALAAPKEIPSDKENVIGKKGSKGSRKGRAEADPSSPEGGATPDGEGSTPGKQTPGAH